MIEIQHLSKRFGLFTAVDDISFQVDKGTVLGFLGPNGAGKSTTMKMITGFLSPTTGKVTVCGHDVQEDAIAAKEVMGYLPEGAPLYPDMTPRGFLGFIAELRGVKGDRRARIEEVVAKVNLQSVLDVPIETLSKGYKRRVGLAQAILHDPAVLVLDEPTDGLDPNQKHEVRALIRSMARDKVVVLSTHILEEVEALCTRTIIIANGKLVVDCTPAQLAAKSRYHNAVSLTIPRAQRERVEKSLNGMAQVASLEFGRADDSRVTLIAFPRPGASLVADIGGKARDERWEIDELHVEPGRLDEVFRTLTGFGSVAAN